MREKGLEMWKFKAKNNCEVYKTDYCRVRLSFLTEQGRIPEASVLPTGSRATTTVVFSLQLGYILT